MVTTTCPLCFDSSTLPFHSDKRRDYRRCRQCQLVFVPRDQHLSPIEEKAIYDLHQNALGDQGYRSFLSRLTAPLQIRLTPGSSGLDYGCGPGPLLARMLAELGHRIEIFDPLYADNPNALKSHYDFVTCTEVAEHFREPAKEFDTLFGLLKPNGVLALMTKLVIDADAFSRWHYKNDLTHVSFFSESALRWLADTHRARLEIIGKDVIIFHR